MVEPPAIVGYAMKGLASAPHVTAIWTTTSRNVAAIWMTTSHNVTAAWMTTSGNVTAAWMTTSGSVAAGWMTTTHVAAAPVLSARGCRTHRKRSREGNRNDEMFERHKTLLRAPSSS
jgi:hypothetical protein